MIVEREQARNERILVAGSALLNEKPGNPQIQQIKLCSWIRRSKSGQLESTSDSLGGILNSNQLDLVSLRVNYRYWMDKHISI